MTFDENVKRLVQYGIESGLVPEEERIYTTNQLLELFGEEEYTEPETEFKDVDLEEVLEELLDYACLLYTSRLYPSDRRSERDGSDLRRKLSQNDRRKHGNTAKSFPYT